ncbi:MAG: molybdenum cofactor biosynthesis protein MoaE [Phycisphaeraceae bacterium]|nr:molybdenum cofactor biosynthesis protein MoaE [Phycisphaeraceae bacterium]
MSIEAAILDGPLQPAPSWQVDGAGALLCFEGMVRPVEAGEPITGLSYETYDPMAERELERLAREAVERFALLAVKVEHSRGFVPSFACSFRLRIASSHRKEALAAMDWFIDRMKQAVPIWKRPIPVEQSQETAR